MERENNQHRVQLTKGKFFLLDSVENLPPLFDSLLKFATPHCPVHFLSSKNKNINFTISTEYAFQNY
jgi:hypothetical protein